MIGQGRPPSPNVTAASEDLPYREAVVIASKNRMTLSTQIRKRVAWLRAGTAVDALAVLEEPGYARLVLWSRYAEPLDSLVQRISKDPSSIVAQETALAIQDRYSRIHITDDGRMVLPSELIAHLDPQVASGRPFYIVALVERIELASEEYRLRRWITQSALSDDLP